MISRIKLVAILLFLFFAFADFGITMFYNVTEYDYLNNPKNVAESNPFAKSIFEQGFGVALLVVSIFFFLEAIVLVSSPYLFSIVALLIGAFTHFLGFLSWLGYYFIGGKLGYYLSYSTIILVQSSLLWVFFIFALITFLYLDFRR